MKFTFKDPRTEIEYKVDLSLINTNVKRLLLERAVRDVCMQAASKDKFMSDRDFKIRKQLRTLNQEGYDA